MRYERVEAQVLHTPKDQVNNKPSAFSHLIRKAANVVTFAAAVSTIAAATSLAVPQVAAATTGSSIQSRPSLTLTAKKSSTATPVVYSNVSYCPDLTSQKIDIYEPAKPRAKATYPVVMNIHGGAYVFGDKTGIAGGTALIDKFIDSHFVFASVNYTMGVNSYPQNSEEIACAIRFLKANASTYLINPNEVGLLGQSAGGQLAATAALTGASGIFNAGQYLNYSSTIQAVATWSGLTNLMAPASTDVEIAIAGAFGTTANMVAASSTTYVAAGAPPFLVGYGLDDKTVPPATQSTPFVNDLSAVGDSVKTLPVKNAGHLFGPTGPGPMSPSMNAIDNKTVDFFKSNLR